MASERLPESRRLRLTSVSQKVASAIRNRWRRPCLSPRGDCGRPEGDRRSRRSRRRDPDSAGPCLRGRSAADLRPAPGRAARPPRGPAGRDRLDRPTGLPAGDQADPGSRLDGRAGPRRPGRPPGRDHRADRAEDGDQRAELRRQGLAGRPGGRQHPALGRTWSSGQVNLYDAVRRQLSYDSPEGKAYRLRDDGRLAVARGAPARLALRRAARAGRRRARSSARWSTSGCTSSTTPPSCWRAGAGRTSTCRRWRATSRPGCGTTSSSTPRSARHPASAPSAQRCSSRRSPPRSRWTRSSTSCATTCPGSTPGAGTTCSASSRTSATPAPASSCPTAPP